MFAQICNFYCLIMFVKVQKSKIKHKALFFYIPIIPFPCSFPLQIFILKKSKIWKFFVKKLIEHLLSFLRMWAFGNLDGHYGIEGEGVHVS